MFMIFAHPQLAAYAVASARAGFVEPVFAVYVIGHQLVGLVARCREGEVVAFIELVVEA